ncbi:ribosomal RNA large subunit methyltransferase I [Geobacter sp. OR-1]|uniref:class I SAM-dependent rRNA methyltransferase n=1 Tax=Geobacter sp. OR-1 TaxID=1266765 RepID=UPI0005420267|nr:class I SAM-dependent rRNA methyltransferase [Geobacter sp. OR-1]GAM09914.1 ribosomal RNA large subunit methyltransferase I [Geobacter sp. OR-1]
MKQPLSRTISPETARMLELGHPWVVADGFTKRWQGGATGDLIELVDGSGRFLATALLDPAERVVARVLAKERIRLDRSWLKARLEAAARLRKDHADLADSDAYRLVNAEGDGLPGLTVDRYGEFLMVQLFSSAWKPHLGPLVQAIQDVFSPQGVYEKSRPVKTRELEAVSEGRVHGSLIAGVHAPEQLLVRENGLNFLVRLRSGLNTGLFIDQRKNRREIMPRVKGKRVLNLFSYTGAFSVAAAASGASLVTSVDASSGYMEWARENFGANRLNPKKHRFIVGDCFSVLQDLAKKEDRYDMIIMDPPSFSTTGKSMFTTRKGTSDLVAAALAILPDGGMLVTSSNHQKVDIAEYLKELRRGALQAKSELRVISLAGQPEDFPYPVTFPEGRYLKFAICVKTG